MRCCWDLSVMILGTLAVTSVLTVLCVFAVYGLFRLYSWICGEIAGFVDEYFRV